ncbi:MAG: hypothetical protein A3B86_01565 [Candidatus Yanofskybacteria bacterium RIFCSPHIGHO2_02_FULL_38_22b]|uniref:DUF5671 domain-containing protein n=1 Tax=Candidatus Yanofskybacteria bacterium RIFCSPHIGHO2_02_FULL_38_22b TaxID=1802673 RepID=A0A1F8F423_9BACT|nr:MAG: hypothetical protein A3B86_01565 [Candidatus Yanofskybacteria bacterium RIFCSPHIGHO2_02_FULL_38_22b]OGN19822.1 MAG: hypothetical protein A2910_02065 [Candidatus Yanofskybacteria bacterium RIFCSPLOWO2_01_FULL_39_28]
MNTFESFTLWQIPLILSRLSCYFFQFAGIIFVIWIIYVGIKFLLARGNPTAFSETRKTFLYSLLGGLIIYGVYTIILSVAALFGVSSLSWIPLSCS